MDVENRTNYVCVSVCPSSSKSHIPPVNNHNFKKIPGKVECSITLIEDYQIEIAKLHPSFFMNWTELGSTYKVYQKSKLNWN